jgi:hypothetical protein
MNRGKGEMALKYRNRHLAVSTRTGIVQQYRMVGRTTVQPLHNRQEFACFGTLLYEQSNPAAVAVALREGRAQMVKERHGAIQQRHERPPQVAWWPDDVHGQSDPF